MPLPPTTSQRGSRMCRSSMGTPRIPSQLVSSCKDLSKPQILELRTTKENVQSSVICCIWKPMGSCQQPWKNSRSATKIGTVTARPSWSTLTWKGPPSSISLHYMNWSKAHVILTQIDDKREHQVIAYASRKLVQHEKNYMPYLLEMQAAIWAMEHFDTHLCGCHFTLFTDHRPLEKLGKVHTKTLNRLQEAMLTFDFEIVYMKGSKMPADFLSRKMVVDCISFDEDKIRDKHMLDPRLQALKKLLNSNTLRQYNSEDFRFCKLYQNNSLIYNRILYWRLRRTGEPDQVVLFAPPTMRDTILHEAHGAALSRHRGTLKTKERILQSYFWPGMDQDIQTHLKTSQKCQLQRTRDQTRPLSPLPQCTQPNQRILADLFGFLVVSGRGKKYILCITDAFTKYVELVAIDNKEAATVA